LLSAGENLIQFVVSSDISQVFKKLHPNIREKTSAYPEHVSVSETDRSGFGSEWWKLS